MPLDEEMTRPVVQGDDRVRLGGKPHQAQVPDELQVAARGGRHLVVAMMYGLVHEGGPTYWDQAASLLDWGFALNPQSAIGAL